MKPVLIVAGAGSTGRVLVERLLPRWEIRLIDKDGEALARVADQDGLVKIAGDATSGLVLEQAAPAEAYACLALMGQDEANLEMCRLARERFGTRNRLAVVHNNRNLPRFESEEISAVNSPSSIALALQSRLETGRRTTSDVGMGQGEIYEVSVLPRSPVVGKTLADLRPQSWLVAAIYRRDKLVVPHGKTAIQAEDRVLLVGDPAVLPSIADYFHSGSSHFPMQFGSRIAFVAPHPADPRGPWEECRYLLESTHAMGLRAFLPDRRQWTPDLEGLEDAVTLPLRTDWETTLGSSLDAADSGLTVVPPPVLTWRDRLGLGNGTFLKLVEQTEEPLLISRGSFPYQRILLAASESPSSVRAGELALDLARTFGARLTAVATFPPVMVTGEEHHRRLRERLNQIKGLGSIYGVNVSLTELAGNPIHAVLAEAANSDLLVLAHRARRPFYLTQPDVSRHLLLRAPCSVMALPHAS